MNLQNLSSAIAGSEFGEENVLIGPKGDEFHHLQSVDILKGEDDYKVTNLTSVTNHSIVAEVVDINVPFRPRGMSGVVLTYWSEEDYLWSRQLLFHKGQVYESDTLITEDVVAKPVEIKKTNQLSMDI